MCFSSLFETVLSEMINISYEVTLCKLLAAIDWAVKIVILQYTDYMLKECAMRRRLMDKKALGKRVKIARHNKGYTGEKLAEMCNINATYLRQIEGGAKIPSLPMFTTLCIKLGVSPSYLLFDIFESNDSDCDDMDQLLELWKKASPKQIKMIAKISEVVLDFSE